MLAARLAQPVERKALNLVVVGSSPTVGVFNVLTRAAAHAPDDDRRGSWRSAHGMSFVRTRAPAARVAQQHRAWPARDLVVMGSTPTLGFFLNTVRTCSCARPRR